MLQKYLNANLLTVTSDEDSKKLKKAANEISKKLATNKYKIVSYTLSSIDPDVSANNPVISEVKEIIIKNWNTFLVNAKDTPLTYIRAVIFEALESLSENINHSLLIWLSSRNVVNHLRIIGNEKEIIQKFLSKIGSQINEIAIKNWSLSNVTESRTTVELKAIAKYLINDESLIKYLEDAVGPKNQNGVSNFDSPNQHWPNSGSSWSYQFPLLATNGIKNVIDLSLKAIVNVANENKTIIQNSLNKVLEQIQKEVSDKNKSLQLRSELLWWKEAAYSSSTDKSYKELDKNILDVVLAYDYSLFIPAVYPKSVDYFLKETYNTLKKSDDPELVLEDILKIFRESPEELKTILSEPDILEGKSTLLNFVNGLIWNKCQLTQFEDLVGIPLNIKLSPNELTVWLFHDFQLEKILNTK